MRFVGLRHGQSTYNLRQLCNDDPARDVRLTELGVQQARAAIPQLQACSLRVIHCSPLPRTLQTAEIVNAVLGLPLHVEPALADIRSGFDGRPVAEYMAAIAHDPLHARVNGGESIADHFARVSGFLDALAGRGEQDVLLVAHEETLRVFKAWAEGLEAAQVIGLSFENCRPYRFFREE
jgi:probable phosphoglycerate mutase